MTELLEDLPLALELLVDGELSNEEYEILLRHLDEIPGGWRQCALAFLEDQAFRRDIACGDAELGAPSQVSPSPRVNLQTTTQPVVRTHRRSEPIPVQLAAPPSSPVRPNRPTRAWWAFAAVALLGFLVGLVGDSLRRHSDVGERAIGRPLATRNEPNQVTFPPQESLGPPQQPSVSDASSYPPRLVETSATTTEPWELPVYSFDAQKAAQIFAGPSESARAFTQAFQEAGHLANSRWEFKSLRLEDGRQIVIPVEQVEVISIHHSLLP